MARGEAVETTAVSESEPTQEVALVRHGETEWSRDGKHTGLTDVPLTEPGRRQAGALGALLTGRTFELVLTSPLSRAAETCALAGLGAVARVCSDLVEWDYGAYEGRTTAEIRTTVPGWTVWTHPVLDGETVDGVGSRADRVIDLIRGIEGDVALFAHGHLLRVLAARWCGLEARQGRLFSLGTASFCLLGYERGTPGLKLWNQTSHLQI
jgi:broad specificity phosphatase PhoE